MSPLLAGRGGVGRITLRLVLVCILVIYYPTMYWPNQGTLRGSSFSSPHTERNLSGHDV